MCGIGLCVKPGCRRNKVAAASTSDLPESTKDAFRNRGPDVFSDEILYFSSFSLVDPDSEESIEFRLISSVLHMRGQSPVVQPLRDVNTGSFLQFNGEIYGGLEMRPHENDGCALLNRLVNCETAEEICQLLSNLEGEFALVYFEAPKRRLWITKDKIGRRSLLFATNPSSGEMLLSSLALPFDSSSDSSNLIWTDLQAGMIFQWNLDSDNKFSNNNVDNKNNNIRNNNISNNNNISIHPMIDTPVNPIHIPFGVDFLPSTSSCHSESIVDNLMIVNTEEDIEIMENSEEFVTNVLGLLAESVRRRLMCDHAEELNMESHVAVLYSGGLDSTLLAVLAHLQLDTSEASQTQIDLLNLAFAATKSDESAFESCPDRKTGVQSYELLRRLYPSRPWNFVRINVAHSELETCRRDRIRHLIQPACSVLDDTIGCALWFAARGVGECEGVPYTTPSRLMLLGAGADELFGGYSRYRTRYNQSGVAGLAQEMEMDQRRLWLRNYGRDDRVLCDHGREPRYPYLDERLVAYVNALPINVKCDLTKARGIGEKQLLRQVACRLGLDEVAYFAKRAIQFGTRIAKMDNRKEKASDKCHRLVINRVHVAWLNGKGLSTLLSLLTPL